MEREIVKFNLLSLFYGRRDADFKHLLSKIGKEWAKRNDLIIDETRNSISKVAVQGLLDLDYNYSLISSVE